MTSTLKDFKKNIAAKLRGEKYSQNLLGEDLANILRQATAKTLDHPDHDLNQHVVELLAQEVDSGKPVKEVIDMLKVRLRMDNPQKQYLAICLVGKIMLDCTTIIAPYQEELLHEVAVVMTQRRPASEAATRARGAAKELLRRYGRVAAAAVRHVQQQQQYHPAMMYGRTVMAGGPQVPHAQGQLPPNYNPAMYGGETASVMDEVRRLMEQSRTTVELLNDMLVNVDGIGDFERQLSSELAVEVREYRDLFNAYLEQLGAVDSPEAEVLMCDALETVDAMDAVLALERDINSDQASLIAQAERVASAHAPVEPQTPLFVPVDLPVAAPPPPAPIPEPKINTLSATLDDLAEGLTGLALAVSAPPPAQSPQHAMSPMGQDFGGDPFLASVPLFAMPPPLAANLAPSLYAAPKPAAPAPMPAPAAVVAPSANYASTSAVAPAAAAAAAAAVPGGAAGAVPKSAFEAMFMKQSVSDQVLATLAASAPSTAGAAAAAPAPPAHYYPPAPAAAPQAQPAWTPSPPQAAAAQPQPAWTPTPAQAPVPQPHAQPAWTPSPPQVPAAAPAWTPSPAPAQNNPFAKPAVPVAAPAPTVALTSNNPFAKFGPPTTPAAPAQPYQQPAAAAPAAPAQVKHQASIDAEWDLFFADRAAAAAVAPAPVDAHQLAADFNRLVAKPKEAGFH